MSSTTRLLDAMWEANEPQLPHKDFRLVGDWVECGQLPSLLRENLEFRMD